MKLNHLLLVSVAAFSSVSLFASADIDRKIEDAATASYNYRTVLQDQVKVKVHDGVVTLTGAVEDKSSRDLAADTVENLPGVLRVENKITVTGKYPEHSDAWIAFKIRTTLLTRANVSAADTQVNVSDGAVTLTGKAKNLAQKELTGVYAKEIDNVKSVKNEITVVETPADERTMAEAIDDASITSQVKYALLSHRATSALKTKVTTKDGVVGLSGVATSDAEKSLASKLAEGIRGVKSVNNAMTVKS